MTTPHGALVGGALRARGFYAHIWGAWCRFLSAHGTGQRGVALMPILYTLGVKYMFTRSLVSFSLDEWGPAYGTRHLYGGSTQVCSMFDRGTPGWDTTRILILN
jgi:hypothetical protein